MQRLLLGLELHDLVPEGGHLGLDAIDRLALFENLGAGSGRLSGCGRRVFGGSGRRGCFEEPPLTKEVKTLRVEV
jgi:hypothetical protein